VIVDLYFQEGSEYDGTKLAKEIRKYSSDIFIFMASNALPEDRRSGSIIDFHLEKKLYSLEELQTIITEVKQNREKEVSGL
jgi:hypothetical protein